MKYKVEKIGKKWVVIETLSQNIVSIKALKREAETFKNSFDGFTPSFILRKVA